MTIARTPAEAVASRRSVRAFLSDPVSREVIEEMLALSSRAPSGTNTQPWQVIVLTGAALRDLGRELSAMWLDGDTGSEEYHYYPRTWREPYLQRRRKVGWDLYGSLGIAKGEVDKMARQHARNFTFFDAPVGMLFTMDRDMEIGSWLDLGMFMQNIMVIARSLGLDTCPQASFSRYHGYICERLGIPLTRQLICGMALGRADPNAPVNQFKTERQALSDFIRHIDTALPRR